MELKITKEKVLDAASKCSTAKATLQVLFPEAFVDNEWNLLENKIKEAINYNVDKVYDIIPGSYSRDKAKWIVELIKSNLPK